jgi:limonene-1,2-epoxide hydrolase
MTMKTKANRTLTEEDYIHQGISQSGGEAYHRTLKSGIAVTVLQEDKIQRIYPDGRKVVIGQIERRKQKTTATRFRLK